MVDRSTILNAFRPNSEIENPFAFAGRKQELKNLADALQTDRTCPVIYGERGLGKTSLAIQIAKIALGDETLLNQIGAKNCILPDNEIFVPFLISCSDAIRTKDGLLQRMINAAESFHAENQKQGDVEIGKTTRRKVGIKIFEHETTKKYGRRGRSNLRQMNMEDRFQSVVERLQKDGSRKLLFIVDEIDRVANTDGLANFIKNTSSANVKFLLVGIANSISTLLSDHESIERNLYPVRVQSMTGNELKEIVNRALSILNEEEVDIGIEDPAIGRLVSASAGFPWFVHVLGQEALRAVWDSGRKLITTEDVENAVKSLAESRFAQQFSDTYQVAVRDSRKRELVLRLMAKWDGNDVPLSEIYPAAKNLGVRNPSVCKKDLMQKQNGASIVAPPLHEKGQIRFRNAVFKRYINLRPSIYTNVKEEVDKEWSERT